MPVGRRRKAFACIQEAKCDQCLLMNETHQHPAKDQKHQRSPEARRPERAPTFAAQQYCCWRRSARLRLYGLHWGQPQAEVCLLVDAANWHRLCCLQRTPRKGFPCVSHCGCCGCWSVLVSLLRTHISAREQHTILRQHAPFYHTCERRTFIHMTLPAKLELVGPGILLLFKELQALPKGWDVCALPTDKTRLHGRG